MVEGESNSNIVRELMTRRTATPDGTSKETPVREVFTTSVLVLREEVSLYQGIATGLTEAGLGTFAYELAEEQIDPTTQLPLDEASPHVVVSYTGDKDRDRVHTIVSLVRARKRKAELDGYGKKAIDEFVQNEIRAGIESEHRREMILMNLRNADIDSPQEM